MRQIHLLRAALTVVLPAVCMAVVVPGCKVQSDAGGGATAGAMVPTPSLRREAAAAERRGEWTKAQDLYQALLDRDSADWKANFGLARCYMAVDAPFDAQRHLESARAIRDEHAETADILDLLADALRQQKRDGALRELINSAVERYDASRDYLRKGRVLAELGEPDGALPAFQIALKRSWDEDQKASQTPGSGIVKRSRLNAYGQMADFYESLGNRKDAVSNAQHAYWCAPRNKDATARLQRLGLVPGPTHEVAPADPRVAG